MAEPLDYAPPEPPKEPIIDAVLRILVIVGIVMVLVGSITLDGGALLVMVSLFFGASLVVVSVIALSVARPPRTHVRLIALIVGLAMLGIGLGSAGQPSRARPAANQVKCASNLRQIGQTVFQVAQTNGRYPDTLDELVGSSSLPAETLVCPQCDDTVAPGATAAQQAANLRAGRHVSYVYVGKGLPLVDPPSPNAVVAYELPANHDGRGANFLFADGHVDWLIASDADRLIRQIQTARSAAAPASQPVAIPPAR